MTPRIPRRTVLAGTAAAAAGSLVDPSAAGANTGDRAWDLTVLGTSDIHGNVYNWDYYRDAEYDDSAHNDIGVASRCCACGSGSSRSTGHRPAA